MRLRPNPHFLFNTLNTLYGLLILHSDKAEATLERFINLTTRSSRILSFSILS